jgi:hypothetical protein
VVENTEISYNTENSTREINSENLEKVPKIASEGCRNFWFRKRNFIKNIIAVGRIKKENYNFYQTNHFSESSDESTNPTYTSLKREKRKLQNSTFPQTRKGTAEKRHELRKFSTFC